MQQALRKKACGICSWNLGWEMGRRRQGAQQFLADGSDGEPTQLDFRRCFRGFQSFRGPSWSSRFFLASQIAQLCPTRQEAVTATSTRIRMEQCSVAII